MSPRAHAKARTLIQRHFALSISPSDEHTLRQHLADCQECGAWYERHLLLASLDPRAPSDERRLAVGLGLSSPRHRSAFSVQLGLAFAVVAMFALFFYTKPAEFEARGQGEHGRVAQVFVYRVQAGQAAAAVNGRFTKTDELAFAYVNSAGFEKLMIFGVDEHQHVYWYHPGWSSQAENPHAIDIESGPELHELPEAIAHQLDGKSLKIHALFSNSELSVRDVERMLKEGAGATPGSKGSVAAALQDAVETEMPLVVE